MRISKAALISQVGFVSMVSLLAFGCSDANFGSAKSAKAEAGEQEATTNTDSASAGAEAADKKGTDTVDAKAAGSEGGGGTAFDGKDFGRAKEGSNDAKTVGCQLPESVAKAMGSAVKNPGAGLTGWGGGGGSEALNLRNLDLNSCEWFQAAKKAAIARYMITFTDKDQSFAAPFGEGVNPVLFAACLAQATVVSASAGGPVSCSFMPL